MSDRRNSDLIVKKCHEQQLKIEKLQRRVLELLKQNEEVMCGQKYYVAKKHDNIDNALAKYLNSLGDKLKISFIRTKYRQLNV